MQPTDRDNDEFLTSIPEGVRNDMITLDREISAVMQGLPRVLLEGKLWGGTDQEIIGYGLDSYLRSDGKRVEWFVVGLARQKSYISLYVNTVEDRLYLAEKYGKRLGKVKVGKSSISFARLDDIDLHELVALVTKAREITSAKG
jgi:hypothetical protein